MTVPLTEATFLILLALKNDPLHGYAILKKVAEMSDQRVVFSTGTLYGALKRLLDQNWIERVDTRDDHDEEDGRNRKAYQLTILGKQIFQAEVSRMQQLVTLSQITERP